MRTLKLSDFAAALLVLSAAAPLTGADLASQLKARYHLTSVNAEGGIVNQGATLVLKRGGLVGGVNATCVNDYKNGKISMGGNLFRKGACAKGVGTVVKTFVAGSPDNATRPFVAGEKVYVTNIDVRDAVIFSLISDSISDVRYRADLAFLKGGSLELGPAQDAIGEVFKIESGGGAPAAKPAATSAAVAPAPTYAPEPVAVAVAPVQPPVDAFAPIAPPPPPPADAPRPAPRPAAPSAAPPSVDPAAIAPIAPPPPPVDQTTAQPAISPGLTVDQVAAILGQPQRVADLGSKKVYSYGNLKVTFVNDRVTDFHDASKEPDTPPQTSGFKLSTTTIVLIVAGVGIGLSLLAVGALLMLRSRGNNKGPAAAAAVQAPPPPPPTPSVRPLDPPAMPLQRTEPTPWPPARAVSLPVQPLSQPPVLPTSQPPWQAMAPPPIQAVSQPVSQPPVLPPSPPPAPQPTARHDEYKTLMDLGIISAEEYESERTKRSTPAPPPALPTMPVPPPPMPVAPTTIVLGQTEDQVMRILGQPQNVVDLGVKKIYVYPVLKVTFTDGKVADVH